MTITVGDVAAAMDRIFPPATAQAWDRVGLAVGDVHAPVRRIGFAVDPCEASVEEAIERGADMLITHHPATDHLWDGGCALVCATHWASEWPVLALMDERLRSELGDRAPEAYVSRIPTDPWTLAVR